MSRQKWTLTRAEQTEYRKRVERLRAAGADLDVSSFEPAGSGWINITHDRVVSCVRALPTASLFLIDVRIVALAPQVIIQGFELSSPEWELGVWFLEDPTLHRSDDRRYRFRDGTNFRRDEVLNHRLAEATLRYGDVMEGMLLAESLGTMPSHFADKRFIPICLSIMNQFDDVHESMIELRVERTAGRIQPRPPRRSRLFEREDGSPGSPELGVEAPGAVSPKR